MEGIQRKKIHAGSRSMFRSYFYFHIKRIIKEKRHKSLTLGNYQLLPPLFVLPIDKRERQGEAAFRSGRFRTQASHLVRERLNHEANPLVLGVS